MTQYAVCFDFPELDGEPLFAGMVPGTKHNPTAFGLAPTLESAAKYDDEATAERVLRNAYGPHMQSFGSVVEVAP